MSILQLDTENADRDLTSIITVLTDTPDASLHMLCQGYIKFGDGAKNLDGTGGTFELTVTVGGQTIEPQPQEITFSSAVRAGAWTVQFPVVAGEEVILRAKSPNGADTDVDVTAYLFDVSGSNLTHVMGTILTEGAGGRLAAAIIKLFDVVTPTLVASSVMRGTDGANTTVPDAAGVAPTAAEVSAQIAADMQTDPTDYPVNLKEIDDTPIQGDGSGTPWEPV